MKDIWLTPATFLYEEQPYEDMRSFFLKERDFKGFCVNLRPRGGRKLALQNGKVEGSEVGKNTALFLEAGVKSPLYVALCPDPPAREEREERRKDERQRGEREREREREMREMRKR